MSSGFVSAGTADLGESSDNAAGPPELSNDAWAAAKAKVEEANKPREEEPEEERSLFAILQANKVKKQEEFEEKLKFKNQFKPLDEDDVEYLDSILTGERRAEEARKQELEAQLDAFRQHQSEVEQTGATPEAPEASVESGNWGAAGRKRRKKDDGGKGGKMRFGVKVRKTSSATKVDEKKDIEKEEEKIKAAEKPVSPVKDTLVVGKKEVVKSPVVPAAGGLLGLVAYDSDDDDD